LHSQHKLTYFKEAGWEQEWINTAEKIVRMEFHQLYAYCGDDIEDDETPVGGTPAADEVSCEPFHPNCYINYHSM
jgi:hypothetical protein